MQLAIGISDAVSQGSFIFRINMKSIIILLLLHLVQSVFRTVDRPPKWLDDPQWNNYTDFNISDTSIKLAWRPPYNTGFYYVV